MRRALVAVALFGCKDVSSHGAVDAAVDARPDAFVDPDAAAPANPGFTSPTGILAAWTEPSPGTFTQQALDLSCLEQTRSDPATTTTVSLAVTVRDFQSGNLVPGAQVSAFPGVSSGLPFAMGAADTAGTATLAVPTNQRRIGFRVTTTSTMPTYSYDRVLAPSTASQSLTVQSISNATGATLPALIGVTRTPGTAIALAVMHDCAGHTVSSFVATVSTTATTPMHAVGAQTYYFSDSVGLPVRHTQAPQATRDGRFMVIDVPPMATAWLQVWGYRDASELAAQTMTRIASFAVPFTADSAVTVTHEPWSTF